MANSPATAERGARTTVGPNVSVRGVNFAAAFQHENSVGTWPPDTDVAAGSTQIVQTTDSSIDVWKKVSSGVPTHLASFSENSFVGNADSLGDGRVLYDFAWGRWVILIDDFSNLSNSGLPEFFLAVSKTSNAAGSYFVYPVAINTSSSGLFFDYPQLGLDQDAVLITGNWFQGNTFISPSAFAIAKARIYNGFGVGSGFSFSFPGASVGTLAPPIVLAADQDFADYFIAAPVGAGQTNILKFTMQRAGRTSTAFSGPVNIPVTSYSTPPPLAPQTCSATNSHNLLDTLDGRFQSRSLQNGVLLWNAHTIARNSTSPGVRWYEFNTSTNTVRQFGNSAESSSSFDFNPSIGSAAGDEAALNWTATDPHAATPHDAMMITAGRKATDPLGLMTPNTTPLVISSTCMTQNFDSLFGHQRWGAYSAVAVDSLGLTPTSFYWIVNEFTAGTSTTNFWKSEIARVANP